MIAESASRLVSGFVDAGVFVVFLPLLGGALVLGRPMARKLGCSGSVAVLAMASVAAILAITLGVRAVSGGGLGDTSFQWLVDGDLWSHSVDVRSGWLLNLVLFVPAGLFVSLATRRPARTLLALIGLSLLIECIQSFDLLGAPDPADLVANSLGAGIGVAMAASGLRLTGASGDIDKGASRRALLIATAVVVAVAGIGWLGLVAGADARQASLADDIRRAFAGSTSVDISRRVEAVNGFEQLLASTHTRPTYLGRVGDTNQFEARYAVEFFGFHRCIFIRWTPDGFTLRKGSGEECTVFREHPPSQ